MKPISINYEENPYCIAHDVLQALYVLERMRRISDQYAVEASIGLADDQFGDALEIGINQDRGFARFAGRDGIYMAPAIDPTAEGTTWFQFQQETRDLPRRLESSFEAVQLAVVEYMVHEGKRPLVTSLAEEPVSA